MKHLLIFLPLAGIAQPGQRPMEHNPVPIDTELLFILGAMFGLYFTVRKVKAKNLRRLLANVVECMARRARLIAGILLATMLTAMCLLRSLSKFDIEVMASTVCILVGIDLVSQRTRKRIKRDVYQVQKDTFNQLMDEARKRDEAKALKEELRKRIEEKVAKITDTHTDTRLPINTKGLN